MLSRAQRGKTAERGGAAGCAQRTEPKQREKRLRLSMRAQKSSRQETLFRKGLRYSRKNSERGGDDVTTGLSRR